MKLRHMEMYMSIAEMVAQASYAQRLKVGAVAVLNDRILSTGYNGTLPGADNTCEYMDERGELVTKPDVVHAEMNLICKMAKDGQPALGSVIFITHAPCIDCAKLIVACGFSSVFYRQQYRNESGVKLLKENRVHVGVV